MDGQLATATRDIDEADDAKAGPAWLIETTRQSSHATPSADQENPAVAGDRRRVFRVAVFVVPLRVFRHGRVRRSIGDEFETVSPHGDKSQTPLGLVADAERIRLPNADRPAVLDGTIPIFAQDLRSAKPTLRLSQTENPDCNDSTCLQQRLLFSARRLFWNGILMTSTPRLSIVIVNYAGWPDVERLTAALTTAPEVIEGSCEVIVVNNASPGSIPKSMLDPPRGVRLVARPSNDGFAAGVNAGWQVSRAPWILLLNPDVEVGADFLARLFARLDHYETRSSGVPGIVGYALRNPNGTRQGSVGVSPSLPRCVVEPLIPRARRKYQPASRAQAGPVPWVTGACALARNRIIGSIRRHGRRFLSLL